MTLVSNGHLQGHELPFSPPLSPPIAEWIPLYNVVEQWAAFAAEPEAVNALVLQISGNALLACSCEMSAHTEYVLMQNGLQRAHPRAFTHGLDECLRQLTEACHHWNSTLYWLTRLDRVPEPLLTLVRERAMDAHSQYGRVERLLGRIQEDQYQTIRHAQGGLPQ